MENKIKHGHILEEFLMVMTTKIIVFLNVLQCDLVDMYLSFVFTFRTEESPYETTQHHILKDSNLHKDTFE
jgi:hypothetical protein